MTCTTSCTQNGKHPESLSLLSLILLIGITCQLCNCLPVFICHQTHLQSKRFCLLFVLQVHKFIKCAVICSFVVRTQYRYREDRLLICALRHDLCTLIVHDFGALHWLSIVNYCYNFCASEYGLDPNIQIVMQNLYMDFGLVFGSLALKANEPISS